MCQQLVATTLRHKGCFYLPYRVCFAFEQLQSAYLQIAAFLRTKRMYDPRSKFMNWFARRVEDCIETPVSVVN